LLKPLLQPWFIADEDAKIPSGPPAPCCSGLCTVTNQQDSGTRKRDCLRLTPGELGQQRTRLIQLSVPDKKGQTALWRDEVCGSGKNTGEALDCAESDDLEQAPRQSLGADSLYIDVRQCKSAADFAKEGRLLVIGFEQRQGNVRSPKFDGKSRESGAGANVGNGKSLRG